MLYLPMRNLRFEEARLSVFTERDKEGGIGTLSEKALHKIIKFYIEPNPEYHEIGHLSYVADIKRDNRIFEIQTRAVYRLLPKLSVFLSDSHVTLVLPVIIEKNIALLDKATGELSSAKKSTKKESVYTAISSLYGIRSLLQSDNLSVKLLFMRGTDYRALHTAHSGRAKSEKLSFIPNTITEELDLVSIEDYRRILPENLPPEFTVKEFAKLTKSRKEDAYGALSTLSHIGVTTKCGRRGRELLYKISD